MIAQVSRLLRIGDSRPATRGLKTAMNLTRRERAAAFIVGVVLCSALSSSLGIIAREHNEMLSGSRKHGTEKRGSERTWNRTEDARKEWEMRWPWRSGGLRRTVEERSGMRMLDKDHGGGNGTGESVRVSEDIEREGVGGGGSVTMGIAVGLGVVGCVAAVAAAVGLVRVAGTGRRTVEEVESTESTEAVVEGIVRDVLDEIAPEEAV